MFGAAVAAQVTYVGKTPGSSITFRVHGAENITAQVIKRKGEGKAAVSVNGTARRVVDASHNDRGEDNAGEEGHPIWRKIKEGLDPCQAYEVTFTIEGGGASNHFELVSIRLSSLAACSVAQSSGH